MGKSAVILYIFLFFSCKTAGDYVLNETIAVQDINDLFNVSNYGPDFFAGISGRMSDRLLEVEYAKIHIANQIAIRNKCVVDTGSISILGTSSGDFTTYDSNFDYDSDVSDSYLESIEVNQVYYFNDLTLIIGKYSKPYEWIDYRVDRGSDEKPEWIRKKPRINGYYVGVGEADRYSVLYKGILAADVFAAQDIAMEKNSFMRSFVYDKIQEGYIGEVDMLVVGDLSLTKSELEGFYVIDRWIEPDGSACYSLGIAKE
jgi:hypothetical protein